jgi:hypothetical protein
MTQSYTMDCSVSNFQAVEANGTPLTNTIDLKVRVLNRDEERLLLPGQQLGEIRYATPRLACSQ